MTDAETLSLKGRLLVAMPTIGDERFERTVIYMCAHSHDKGAMGLVVNKQVDGVDFRELLEQLKITEVSIDALPVQYGGPVEKSRGFVLHSTDYKSDGASVVTDDISLTATLDILRDIAAGDGPDQHILALGYAGWAPGQLEDEIKGNGWLIAEGDAAIVFDCALEGKWDQALASIGVSPSNLSGEGGRA
jgi:putative transcriptional regulator